jgi:hypothetical protein
LIQKISIRIQNTDTFYITPISTPEHRPHKYVPLGMETLSLLPKQQLKVNSPATPQSVERQKKKKIKLKLTLNHHQKFS